MHVLLTHGSSNPEYVQQVEAFAASVSGCVGEAVGVAYLSDQVLPEGAVVLPLFLGEAKHMQYDVPHLVGQSSVTLLPPLLESSDAIAALVVKHMTKLSRRIEVMFVVYQFRHFEKMVASLYKFSKICRLHVMAALHGQPNVSDVLDALQHQGVKKLVIQPMFLFRGHSLNTCQLMANHEYIELNILPALTELDGFVELVAGCLSQGDDHHKVG